MSRPLEGITHRSATTGKSDGSTRAESDVATCTEGDVSAGAKGHRSACAERDVASAGQSDDAVATAGWCRSRRRRELSFPPVPNMIVPPPLIESACGHSHVSGCDGDGAASAKSYGSSGATDTLPPGAILSGVAAVSNA